MLLPAHGAGAREELLRAGHVIIVGVTSLCQCWRAGRRTRQQARLGSATGHGQLRPQGLVQQISEAASVRELRLAHALLVAMTTLPLALLNEALPHSIRAPLDLLDTLGIQRAHLEAPKHRTQSLPASEHPIVGDVPVVEPLVPLRELGEGPGECGAAPELLLVTPDPSVEAARDELRRCHLLTHLGAGEGALFQSQIQLLGVHRQRR
mmetsp:Transcript_125887/g.281271  ORF Transcript_125887/g.281271 Transcript_125887/m.281271 type:complete len:208 (-) Transcript_125887:294-917(-)